MATMMLGGVLIGLEQRPAEAAVTAVKGSACGYFTRIGLPGKFLALRGCGQPSTAPATAASPSVTLPAGGSSTPITANDADGAKAAYDSTAFFGGQWSTDVLVAPPSGPLTATTQGTAAQGTVTSSVDIVLSAEPVPVRCVYDEPGDTNCEAPGGFGPPPVEGEALHVECSASETAVAGTTRVANGLLATLTDEYGTAYESEVIPTTPPVNYTRSGVITSPGRNPGTPGDILSFTVVFNQQMVNADGSITVTGVHTYFFGPGTMGEVVEGQVTCGTTPHPAVANDTVAPTCGIPVIEPWGPEDPSPMYPLTEMIGAFDAGGLQSITNIQATNATVEVGDLSSGFAYRKFTAGQTTPLQIRAIRTQEAEDANLSMYWSFDATDKAGNKVRCKGLETLPVAVNDAYSTDENSPLTVAAPGVLANDTPAGSVVATLASGPANGTLALNENGSFTYTPNPGFAGSDAFTYRASDGSADSNVATVSLTVVPVKEPPSCANVTLTTDEDVTGSTSPSCTDVDEASVSYTIVGQAANGTASVGAGASLTYTPDANFAGTDAFTYRATDASGASNVATVSVTVNPVNDAPVAGDDTFSTNEDTPLTVPGPGVMANDTDVDGDPLTAGSASTATHGTVTLNADGSFAYTPAVNFNGSDSFAYKANDGTAESGVATVSITVASVNDPPEAADDAYPTAAGTPVAVAAPGVLGNDTDVDGDPLSAGSVSDPAGGSVTLASDGSFTYTPDAGFSGTDTFGYTASDGNGGSDTATVTVTVSPPTPTGPTALSVTDVAVTEGDAGTTSATFTVTRSGNASGTSSAKYKTSGGTATAGTDYTAVTTLTTLSFAPGETSKPVEIAVKGDTLPEANETVNLVLSAPTGAAIADTSGTATIVNDDGSAYLAVADTSIAEGNSGSTAVVFTVTRSGNSNGPSTVKYKTSGGTATAGTDYTAVSTLTTITFAAGEITKTVGVNVTGDASDEPNETFNLVLSAASSGTVLSDASGTATIVDDEGTVIPAPETFLTVGDLSITEGNDGTRAATFSVARTGNTSGSSTVKYKTSGGTATAGTDYTAVTTLNTLSFGPGETSKTLDIAIKGDTLPEANETFNLVLSAATGASIADSIGTATILNDDGSAYLSVDDILVTEGNSGTTVATFTVTRSGNTTGTSTLKFTTSGGTATAGTDYATRALTALSFGPGETSKAVTVAVTGDTVVEPNETFNLVLSAPVGATISDASGTATIVNDDS